MIQVLDLIGGGRVLVQDEMVLGGMFVFIHDSIAEISDVRINGLAGAKNLSRFAMVLIIFK